MLELMRPSTCAPPATRFASPAGCSTALRWWRSSSRPSCGRCTPRPRCARSRTPRPGATTTSRPELVAGLRRPHAPALGREREAPPPRAARLVPGAPAARSPHRGGAGLRPRAADGAAARAGGAAPGLRRGDRPAVGARRGALMAADPRSLRARSGKMPAAVGGSPASGHKAAASAGQGRGAEVGSASGSRPRRLSAPGAASPSVRKVVQRRSHSRIAWR